jgi:phospho-N-acetylmuramoyl-pentapeptide-transferase
VLYFILHKLNIIFNFSTLNDVFFRSIGSIFTGFFISLFFGKYIIKKITKFKIKQIIRNDGPTSHFIKNNTPTMGGLIILFSVVISTILWSKINNKFIVFFIFETFYLGFLGFYDDYLKFKTKNSKGLSVKKKLFWQFIFAIILYIFLFLFPQNSNFATYITVPFFKKMIINFSFLYIFLVLIIIIGSSNSVNLADGLDGLAVGNIIIIFFVLSIFSYFSSDLQISNHLKIINVKNAEEISIFLFTIIGSCIGFLWYNSYPAEIFMGDTGSLFLGGILGTVSIFIKQELILLILAGLFVIESISVIIQILYYKFTKKRIFKMAPIHHHFEIKGLFETKITLRFWIIGIMLSIISFVSIF